MCLSITTTNALRIVDSTGYSNFHLYVVSAFRRTHHGPAKAGHYVQKETALTLTVSKSRRHAELADGGVRQFDR